MDFGDYLCERGFVAQEQLAEAKKRWPGHTDTVGALALKLGYLDLSQIDSLLNAQSQRPKLFGELAVEQDFMTSDQVDGLLSVQKLDRCLDLGKVLVVAGALTTSRLVEALAGFATESQSGVAV